MRNINRIIERSAEIDNPLIVASKMEEMAIQPECTHTGIQRNFFLIWIFFSCVIILLMGRIFYLQILQGGYYQEVAEHNRIRAQVIKAPRGVIKGKDGEVLARNIPSFDAVFVPADLPTEYPEKKAIYNKLAEVMGMDAAALETSIGTVEMDAKESFLIKENIGYEAALIIEENYNSLKGVYIEKTARRDYVDGEIFSPIIGYDGKITKEELVKNPDYLMTDYIGKNGLEYTYERLLHGKHGEHRVEVDSNGSIKENLGIINPLPGDELVLNIDAGLQRKTHEILSRIMLENKDAKGAIAVAINPQSGGVMALVSIPSYNNNLFAAGISSDDYRSLIQDERRPMTNRAISGEYPPGSTFKPLVASAALEEKIITEQTTLNCPGAISVGNWVFPDWKTHGITDVKKSIADSVDVFYYAIGGGWDSINGLGINKIAEYTGMFGLGDVLGIDLPGESKGIIPTEEWKFKRFGEKWYIGDDYHCAIGQGYVTATPLQLANYTAAIANGGKLYRPKIVNKIIHSEQKNEEILAPEIIRQDFISKNNIRIVQEGMRQTVTDGSGRLLKDLSVTSAGKTGTAQFGTEEKLHSWYISYAPFENPEIAMVVLIEGGGEGHSWAVPATRDIYQWYYDEQKGTKPLPDKEKQMIPATAIEGD